MVGETLEQANRMGAPRAVALCHNFSGYLSFQSGEWDESERSLRAAVDTYRKHGAASGESLSLQRLGVLLTARGQIDEGLETLEDGVEVAQRATMRSHCLTRLYASIVRNRLASGDLSEGGRTLQLSREEAKRHGNCVTCNGLLLPEAVRVHLGLGQFDEARAEVERLETLAKTYASRTWSAMARHARGRYLFALGDVAKAVEAFQEAEESFEAAGDLYEASRCRVGRARATADAELLDSAHAMLRGLGIEQVEGESSNCI